jgi:UDP:flavonoid glycosyltransferase YjiC (YdhE family)
LVENFLRILVCPLDWGIGHATRCVPVIRQLLHQNHKVIVAADGRPHDFLKEYFPDLEFVRFPGFKVTYPSGNKMIMKMMLQSPDILYSIYKEHRQLKKIIRDYKVDIVISDNRFGLWSKKAYSVYITHQIMIKAPLKTQWAEILLYRAHQWFINHYQECWVPDLPGDTNLAGDLSHKWPLPANGSYIGILSRFEKNRGLQVHNNVKKAPDLLIMLSGPEPQRSVLEDIILKQLVRQEIQETVMLQGLPGKSTKTSPLPGLSLFSHLPDDEIKWLIRHSKVIICRPGYSTLMDLAMLGRNAVLLPTPGQTEQEYLAGHLSAGGLFYTMNQSEFDLDLALKAGQHLPENFDFHHDEELLETRINKLSDLICNQQNRDNNS